MTGKRTGLWRLSLVAWILGLIAIASVEPQDTYRHLSRAFAKVHPELGRPCLGADLRQGKSGFPMCSQGVFNDRAQYERALARWESEKTFFVALPRYWRRLGPLLGILAGWSVGLWGLFYAAKWLLRGVQGGSKSGAQS